MKRVSSRRIKIHRTYDVNELARCLRIHKNTVRRWLQCGLPTIDARRPTLVQGAVLRIFLDTERRRLRQRCGPGELFCLRCRCPRSSSPRKLEYLPITAKSGNLRGICATCGAAIYRRASVAKIFDVAGDCAVTFQQAQQRIMETPELSSNSDLERGPEIDANA